MVSRVKSEENELSSDRSAVKARISIKKRAKKKNLL